MKNYVIQESTEKEYLLVDDGIVSYNASRVPFTQEPSFMRIDRVIKDENGEVLAGINSVMYC